ncbi:MAG: septum formation protein Maf [Bacteroidales bacterium]|nr:septum formation protein Maf [Bacteroidales bacterium]
MMPCSKKLILGSNSPRRKELLAGLDLPFTVDTGNTFTESVPALMPPHEVPMAMARGKSHGFHRSLEKDELLITADTVVIIDNRVLGKPHGREEAAQMLRLLSGRTHDVVTAVVLRSPERELPLSDTARVTFAPLEDCDIAYYIDHYRPFDKAGAYGVQEWIGLAAISRIEGSFYTVMGFPVQRVYAALRHF